MSSTVVGNLNTRHFVKVAKQISIEKLFRYTASSPQYLFIVFSQLYIPTVSYIILNINFCKKIRRSVIKWFYRYLCIVPIRVSFFSYYCYYFILFFENLLMVFSLLLYYYNHSVYLSYFCMIKFRF